MSVNASGRPALPKLAGALPSITVTQVLLQLSITVTRLRIIEKLLSSTPAHFLRFVHLSSLLCSQEVGDQDNAGDDAALEEDNDADGDGDRRLPVKTDADGKDADADGSVLPPAGTPRASCQLTLLTSPARVTRDGHYGDDDCVSQNSILRLL